MMGFDWRKVSDWWKIRVSLRLMLWFVALAYGIGFLAGSALRS